MNWNCLLYKYCPVELQLEKSLLDQKQQQALAEKQKKEIERMDEIRKREQERILEVSMISPKGSLQPSHLPVVGICI